MTVITDGENKPSKGRTLQQWRKSGSKQLCCPAAAQNDTLFFLFFFFADSFLQRKKSLLICCPSGYTKSASDITFFWGSWSVCSAYNLSVKDIVATQSLTSRWSGHKRSPFFFPLSFLLDRVSLIVLYTPSETHTELYHRIIRERDPIYTHKS